MRFYADLHVHSKYSRATSRDLDLEHLAYWAGRKGIAVVATGDFTHPAWAAELKQKLVPAEPGLFRLDRDIEKTLAAKLPPACRALVRFLLSVEISTIYKKGDRTRKVHHLIYAPDFATVDRIAARLARIGNIASDGRPILGLDSHDLLEITLEASPDAYLVPAHIWTPWFAVLGSQSGFDSIAECYAELSEHIFAVETGLSSDPPMNWRLSLLDRYRLVSNSDAHSPAKLGREATSFDCALDYFAIRNALRTGTGYVGTVEFFPEEGKYHLDGHRKCGARLLPAESRANGGRCPVCGEAATIGVLHRIETLADRAEPKPPPTAGEVANLVPLAEVLAEIFASGAASKTVAGGYDRLIGTLGPELWILGSAPIEEIARTQSSLLAEAISRLRAGKVIREAGYDGEYGVIRLFEDSELKRLTAGGLLFDTPSLQRRQRRTPPAVPEEPCVRAAPAERPQVPRGPTQRPASSGILGTLDADQRAAAETIDGPLLIVAGPGSGKTRTLAHRLAHIIAERNTPAGACLAVTFTRRAAAELRDRLARLLPVGSDTVAVHTFHSLGLTILREHGSAAGLHRGFRIAGEAERIAMLAEAVRIMERKAASLLRAISKAKRTPCATSDDIAEATSAYQRALAVRNWVDFDDLVRLPVEILSKDPALAALWRDRFRWISVDEFQDADEQQYRLLTLLAPADGNLCVIGDPNQAIYGFRGADASCFERFSQDYPGAAVVRLSRNYRSSGTIVAAASQIIADSPQDGLAELVRGMHEHITIHAAASERAEAEFIVQTIERLIGGHNFFSLDSGRATGVADTRLGFADFAVLARTDAQSAALAEALSRSGIPFKKHSHEALAQEPGARAILHELDAVATGEPEGRPLVDALNAAAARVAGRVATDAAVVRTALQRLAALAESCADRAGFADALALASEADFWDENADRVSLLTLHAAKGLEFSVVFIAGLEDGLLPLHWNGLDEATAAEERRLLYVGMTRAKEQLFLTRALKRLWRGRLRSLPVSPFLDDIESELLKHQPMHPLRGKPQEKQLQLL